MKDREDTFFIGWGPTPQPDRRFLLGASLGLLTLSGMGAALLARSQTPVGSGTWNQGAVRTFEGMLLRDPFPVLRTTQLGGAPRTAFLATSGKTGLQKRLSGMMGGPVKVTGSLIQRGSHAMIAVVDTKDGIVPAPNLSSAQLTDWPETDLGEALLVGEILDAKCWFGAMRPSSGYIHKECASLCMQGGLPPAFCSGGVACGDTSQTPLLLRADGRAHGSDLWGLAADPVRALGRLVRVGDITQFRVDVSAIHRL